MDDREGQAQSIDAFVIEAFPGDRTAEVTALGRSPGRPTGMNFDIFDKGTPALDGKALRRQVTIYFSPDKRGPKMD